MGWRKKIGGWQKNLGGPKYFEGGQIFWGWYFEVAKMLGDNKQFFEGWYNSFGMANFF